MDPNPMKKPFLIIVVLLLVGSAALWWYRRNKTAPKVPLAEPPEPLSVRPTLIREAPRSDAWTVTGTERNLIP